MDELKYYDLPDEYYEELNSNFEYKSVIDNFLQPYINRLKNFKKSDYLILEFDLYEGDQDHFYEIKFSYENFLQLISSLILFFNYNPINTIYKNIMGKKINCDAKIEINEPKDMLTYYTIREKLSIERKGETIQKNIATDFKDCQFGVINVRLFDGKEGHSNMIFVERQVLTPERVRSILNYYEPHGRIRDYLNDFIFNLESKSVSIDNIEYIIEFANYSKDIGLQTYTNDSFGFCNSFSLFWLNIVLLIVNHNLKRNTYSPSSLWINEVEEYILFYNVSKEDLFKIILMYINDIFGEYLYEINSNLRESYHFKINEEIYKKYRNDLKKIDKKKYIKYLNELKERVKPKESYTIKELIKESKTKPDLLYEEWEKYRISELKEYTNEKNILSNEKLKHLWKDLLRKRGYNTDLKLIGRKCKHNNECFSGYCKDKECYPKIN